jgi:hypothetical protein
MALQAIEIAQNGLENGDPPLAVSQGIAAIIAAIVGASTIH